MQVFHKLIAIEKCMCSRHGFLAGTSKVKSLDLRCGAVVVSIYSIQGKGFNGARNIIDTV